MYRRPRLLANAPADDHASIAFIRKAYEQVGRWPVLRRADFDQ